MKLPPYSPDLYPCDYHIFDLPKEEQGIYSTTTLLSLSYPFLKLPVGWKKCILKSIDYVEKWGICYKTVLCSNAVSI